MGLVHTINIVAKYCRNNTVFWYIDELNNRYTYTDIVYILNNNILPQNLYVLYGELQKALYPVEINMKLCSDGTLRCTTGLLPSFNIRNKDTICIITEDSNSGYILSYNLLIKRFPDIDFKFIPAHGNTTIYDTYKAVYKLYKDYILITDNKIASNSYTQDVYNILLNIRARKYRLAHLHPLSIEEMLLSWKDLQIKNVGRYNVLLQLYYMTGSKPYVYLTRTSKDDYLILSTNTIVHNLEEAFFEDIRDISYYNYGKGSMQYCIYTDCFLELITNKFSCKFRQKCKHKNRCLSNKIERLYNDSLFGAFDNIINYFFGNNRVQLKHWSNQSLKLLYDLY